MRCAPIAKEIRQQRSIDPPRRCRVASGAGGGDMENHGAVPDIIVPQTPEAESANDDQQLRAAVDDLMKRIK